MEVITTIRPEGPSDLFRLRNWASILDEKTYEQLVVTARSPAPCGDICAMPDAHLGKGSTIGSVIPTRDKIMPAAVGVDIGCGMIAVLTTYWRSDLPVDLSLLHAEIGRSVPAGMGRNHDKPVMDAMLWLADNPPPSPYLEDTKWAELIIKQLGTLGSGNHFIEVCVDEAERIWVVLHSGSRAIGMNIAQRYIKLAKEECRNVKLEDQDLAYLTEGLGNFNAYLHEMEWAQRYARANREIMMNLVLKDLVGTMISRAGWLAPDYLKEIELERINCHHNFTQREWHDMGTGRGLEYVYITRKGAIRANLLEMGIIPGSMATCTYIVEGKASPESYFSSSHGAGRIRSRGAAFRELNVESLREAMAGKAWNKRDADNLVDEHPGAYKDIDVVMRDQEDLTEVKHELHQILNYKGADGSRRKRKGASTS